MSNALFGVDVRSLAAMRILLAAGILLRLQDIYPHAEAFLTDSGVVPRSLFFETGPAEGLSLYFLNGTPLFAVTLLTLNALAAVALLFGYRARLAALVCWILSISLTQRAPLIATGADYLVGYLLFWAMFLPTGSAFAIDAALREEARPRSHLSVASAGLLLQAMYVYFFGALLKTGGAWHAEGSAVYAALHLETVVTPLGHWLRNFPDITVPLTHGVWWLEVLSPAILFFPLWTARVRLIAIPIFIAMHIGFRLFLAIDQFWIFSIASLIAFVPGIFWDWWDKRYWRDRQRSIAIYYDRDCAFCRKISLVLRQFFLPHTIAVKPAQDEPGVGEVLERENSWVVIGDDGRQRLHWRALVYVTEQSLFMRPLSWLLALCGALGLGRRTYEVIGRNRSSLSKLVPAPGRAFRLSAPVQIGLAVVLVFSLAWNLRTHVAVLREALPMEHPMVRTARAFQLLQRWRMFAPIPQLDYVAPVVEARLENGGAVDMINGRPGAPAYEWPTYPVEAVRSPPWRAYFNGVTFHLPGLSTRYFTAYASYICRSWNRDHADGEDMESLKLTLLKGRTLSNFDSDRSGREEMNFRCVDRMAPY
ncbi:MAG: HTTM domain-containing protein [Hyphomonadaceae bacterium]|nr:HTTM domain-containing protein [Hyphomonadaceae bacterium]